MKQEMLAPIMAAAALGAFALSACNTMEGAGRDLQQAGQALEQSAEELNDGDPNTPRPD